MAFLADLVAALALGFVREWLARSDLKRAERERLVIEQLQLEGAALAWLAEARRDPVRWARLRLRDGARAIESFALDAPAPDGPARGDLHDRGRVGPVSRGPTG